MNSFHALRHSLIIAPGGFRSSSQQVTDVVDGSDVQRMAVRARSLTGVWVCVARALAVAL
jgi:hypothetical protein